MPKIYRYKKVQDQYTTYSLREPDHGMQSDAERCTELCTIDGTTYVSCPDNIVLPDQPEQITVEEITLTDELAAQIKAESCHVQLINQRVVEKIRSRYTVNDEIKMLRIGPSAETAAYNDWAEECRTWGRVGKAKLGV